MSKRGDAAREYERASETLRKLGYRWLKDHGLVADYSTTNVTTVNPTDALVARIRAVIQEELARTRRYGWHCRSCDGHACDDD